MVERRCRRGAPNRPRTAGFPDQGCRRPAPADGNDSLPPAEHLWIGRNRGNSCLTAIAARWLMLVEDPGSTRPERHFASGAAQTRTVSVGRIRLDSWKFMRSYKGIICGDISEFESYHPSHAVVASLTTPTVTCHRLGHSAMSAQCRSSHGSGPYSTRQVPRYLSRRLWARVA